MNLFLRHTLTHITVAMLLLTVCVHAAEGEKVALPSAKEVLERYAKAIGGKDKFKQHNSQHALGAVQMKAQGINGKMEVFAARPNKLLMKMTIPGVGEMSTGFDGKVAWMSSALTGPMLLEGKMGEQIATQADFDHALHDPADYTQMEMLGAEQFNGEECYKLRLVHRTGFASTEFFSKSTGLQRGFVATQESPLGPMTTTTLVTDYKQFGDLLLPSRISQKAAGVETVMTMDEMEFNKVDAKIFELPPDVKALAEGNTPPVGNLEAITAPKKAPAASDKKEEKK
ncbi:MAG TPA: DUF4412 domain-containing protein [Verrucomicrobiae bacterium]